MGTINCTCACLSAPIHHDRSCPACIWAYTKAFGTAPNMQALCIGGCRTLSFNTETGKTHCGDCGHTVPSGVSETLQKLQAQLLTIRAIIANDTYASTFQNMDDYRKALGEL